MSSLGSFSPLQNPDIDRLSSILGKVINISGEITINAIESNYLFLGTGDDDKAYFFNINGVDSNNPGIQWNDSLDRVQFSSTGTTWYSMEYINAGTGIDLSRGTDTVEVSVDVTDIIDTSEGLKENSNKIQCDFGTGSSQVARGNHSHTYQLSDLSNVTSDTETDGNLLTANGTSWESTTPDSAGVVTKAGSQAIQGDKTFSGNNSFSGSLSVSGNTDFSGETSFSNTLTTSGVSSFNSSTTFSDSLTASGSSSFSGTVSFSNTVGFTGDVTFSSAIKTSSHIDMEEISDPSNPSSNTARLYARDNGSGKTQLCVLFPTGSTIVLATEV